MTKWNLIDRLRVEILQVCQKQGWTWSEELYTDSLCRVFAWAQESDEDKPDAIIEIDTRTSEPRFQVKTTRSYSGNETPEQTKLRAALESKAHQIIGAFDAQNKRVPNPDDRKEREQIVQLWRNGKKYSEIARTIQKSMSTVKRRLREEGLTRKR